MFENYWLISGVISLAWIALIIGYIVVSSRQKKLEAELQMLQNRVDDYYSKGVSTTRGVAKKETAE